MKFVTIALFALPLVASSHMPMRRMPSVVSLPQTSSKSNVLNRQHIIAPAPDSKLLALRGGMNIDNDLLINLNAALFLLIGLQGWLAPKKTIESYGASSVSDEESTFVRLLSSFNIASGVTLLADESAMASVCALAWAFATTANMAIVPKETVPPTVGFIAVLGALGELTRQGKIDAGIATNVLSVLLIPLSLLEILKPSMIFEGFKMPNPSPLSKSIFENFSFSKVTTGLFLLVSKRTGNRGLGLAAGAAVSTLNTIKTATRADKVGLKKPGLIIWTAVQSAIAIFAYMNSKA